MMGPLGRLLPPPGGGRRPQDHQGIWNSLFPPMLKSQRAPGAPTPAHHPAAPLPGLMSRNAWCSSAEPCDQRCLLGPFVFSSWDLMAWMLLRIFFWWPIMVMPRLRTSLGNKDTVKDTCARPQGHNCTPGTQLHPRDQKPGPGSSPLAHQHKAGPEEGPWASSQGQRGCHSLGNPDKAPVTALWGAGAGAGSLMTGWQVTRSMLCNWIQF